jgi:hypothetical protein
MMMMMMMMMMTMIRITLSQASCLTTAWTAPRHPSRHWQLSVLLVCKSGDLVYVTSKGGLTVFGQWEMYWLFVTVLFSFMIAHGEKYTTGVSFYPFTCIMTHSGTLELPWTYDLSQLLLAVVHFITAYTGSAAWKTPLVIIGDYSFSFPTILVIVTVSQAIYGLIRRYRCCLLFIGFF